MVKNKIAKSKIVIDSGYNSQINQAPRRTESIQPLKKTESQIINSQPPTQNVSQVNKPKPLNINEI